jgi:hypothetical protein
MHWEILDDGKATEQRNHWRKKHTMQLLHCQILQK